MLMSGLSVVVKDSYGLQPPVCSCPPRYEQAVTQDISSGNSKQPLHSSIFNMERAVLVTAVSFVSEGTHLVSAKSKHNPLRTFSSLLKL